jgi:dTDP-4-dehydrorhamnose reductase
MIIGITGGRGMLGKEISDLLASAGYEIKIFDLPDFDITADSAAEKIAGSSDIIVNCAAYTAVDHAEKEPETARAVNALAPAAIARAAKSADKYLIHISTDFVFGDSGITPLDEETHPNPLSVYGATKLEGEELIAETGCRHAVIRVEWTYGSNGNNFIFKIISLAEKMDTLKVVADQVGSPTPTASAAAAVKCFIEKQPEGIYHFASNGYASRYDVALFIAEQLNLDTKITPCDSSEFPAPAERPLNSRFDCSKIDKVLDFKRPEWQDALSDFIATHVRS